MTCFRSRFGCSLPSPFRSGGGIKRGGGFGQRTGGGLQWGRAGRGCPGVGDPCKRGTSRQRPGEQPSSSSAATVKAEPVPDHKVPPGENSKASIEPKVEENVESWIPPRVVRALEASSMFDEFRSIRPFRFLHMFSGERDQLGASIRQEAQKARLAVPGTLQVRTQPHQP